MTEAFGGLYMGERALFSSHGVKISGAVFADGESPLKESSDLLITDSTFKWKYPLWYCRDVILRDSSLLETARSGIWYTHGISIENTLIEAPKTFRRSSAITLTDVYMPKAQETLWDCDGVRMKNVRACGDYFGMHSGNVEAEDLYISGNYAFDGAENVTVTNAKLISKDAFWNARNVTVRDSLIVGEYLGWNSENVTFINCTIDSNQGLCYMKNVKLVGCRTRCTDLAFEYSSVDAEIIGGIDSVKNPSSGTVRADRIGEVILEPEYTDPERVRILTGKSEGEAP